MIDPVAIGISVVETTEEESASDDPNLERMMMSSYKILTSQVCYVLNTFLLVFFFDTFDLFFGLTRGCSIRRVLAKLVDKSSAHASIAFEFLTIFVVVDNGATETGNGGGNGVGVVKLNLGILG